MAPTVLHVAPHPDDEAVGCPGALLHLLDRGWNVVSVIASLGFEGQRDRRRAEAEEAAGRAGFVPVFLDPPLNLDLDGDLGGHPARRHRAAESRRGARRLHRRVALAPRRAPRPRGRRPGRAARQAVLPPTVRWWMWGVWATSGAERLLRLRPGVLDRALHILDAYAGELERNDYRPFLTGAGAGQRGHGLRARLRVRLPRRQRAPLRRARHRGAAASTAASWPRNRTTSTRAPSPRRVRRRPHAVARRAERARARGLHPGGHARSRAP